MQNHYFKIVLMQGEEILRWEQNPPNDIIKEERWVIIPIHATSKKYLEEFINEREKDPGLRGTLPGVTLIKKPDVYGFKAGFRLHRVAEPELKEILKWHTGWLEYHLGYRSRFKSDSFYRRETFNTRWAGFIWAGKRRRRYNVASSNHLRASTKPSLYN